MEYHIDAANKVLGRLATEVVLLLRGKHTAHFDPTRVPNVMVTVYNIDRIRVTGRKMFQKTYLHHTGFHGGQRSETLQRLIARDSRMVMRRAVMGMLPKNKLRNKIIKHLFLFKREEGKK